LRVLDGAIAVFDGSEGVQAQSETVWRQGQKYGLPCLCFINKMDKTGADFQMSVDSIRDKLLANPILLQIPIGVGPPTLAFARRRGGGFAGIIDLIRMRAVYYQLEKLGATFQETEIPNELMPIAQQQRHEMIELAAEHDEELMDCYIHDKPISAEMIQRAIRNATLANKLHPVFAGSALKYIGVQRLLDSVVAYLPSPLEKPDLIGIPPRLLAKARAEADKIKKIPVKCNPKASLVALAFKITSDMHGDLSFLRIYQGTLKSGTRVLNTNRNKRENITRIFEMHANERKILDSASAGDIVAVVGLKHTLTGDTVCEPKKPICLPSITFPQTVINMSIEPRTAAEKAKLADALAALRREDPTFECKTDSETGQTIISGMGELHLEVLQHKLVREKKVDVRVSKPKVAYKEAITESAQTEGKFIRQTGGHGQYGHVVLTVEPLLTEGGHWSRGMEFEAKVASDVVPREYIAAVQRGAKQALGSGVLGGYPVVGVKVTLIGGSFHSVDSSDLAFEQAAAIAVEKALKETGPVLLEPVMQLQVVVPEANFGAIQSNLLGKRGLITDCRVHGNMRVIDAKVPLAEMFGYSSEIRSLTAGRGTFTMEPLSYEKVPEQIAKLIL